MTRPLCRSKRHEALEGCPNNVLVDGPNRETVRHPRLSERLAGLEPEKTILVLHWVEWLNGNLLVHRRHACEDGISRGTLARR